VRSAEVSPGRRLVAALEPGEEVLAAIGALCGQYEFRAAAVPVFFGAFTRVTLIGTREPVEDEDAPLPQSTTVEWVEGLGAATVAPGEDGGLIVHLHAAVGKKSDGAVGYAGHVLSAVTHYTVELVVEEILGTAIERRPDPAAHGLNTWRFGRLAGDHPGYRLARVAAPTGPGMSMPATAAPRRASASAASRPMPRAAPVTTATRPVRSPGIRRGASSVTEPPLPACHPPTTAGGN
jgi:predicted DNA-binding protein with PD1-like motif